ncbi:hypothetical protein [Paracoccus gahaiensis]|nr:hypothetical protein [Paracoccus gahaiensis]
MVAALNCGMAAGPEALARLRGEVLEHLQDLASELRGVLPG